MTRVVPAAAAMKMEWDKDVEYPPETASRWLSYVWESLTTIYFTPNMLDWYEKMAFITKYKNFDNIAVYLITKWKKNKNKRYE